MAIADPWVTQIATDLLGCLCDTLAQEPYVPVCRCYLKHSENLPPMDACDCACTVGDPPVEGNGEAWVRVVEVGPAPSSRSGCAGLLEIQLQLGVYRCIQGVVDEDGTIPAETTLTTDALDLLKDFGAMRRAVRCCDAISDYDPVIGAWRPVGPTGGCAGGTLMVTLTRSA